MNEVDRRAPDRGDELRVPIEGTLDRTPVESVEPVPHQTCQVPRVGAGGPRLSRCGRREPRPRKPSPQVVQHGFGHIDAEGRHPIMLPSQGVTGQPPERAGCRTVIGSHDPGDSISDPLRSMIPAGTAARWHYRDIQVRQAVPYERVLQGGKFTCLQTYTRAWMS